MVQKGIDRETPKEDKILVYVSGVRSREIKKHQVSIRKDQRQIYDLLSNISSSFSKKFYLKDLSTKTNIRTWCETLIEKKPGSDERTIHELINEFKDHLQTSQRMTNRYVLLLLFTDAFLLVHCRAERGLATPEEKDFDAMEVVRRIYDADNVDRWCRMEKVNDDKIKVRLYERRKSDSFAKFLGIPSTASYYEFGDVRLKLKKGSKEFTQELTLSEAIESILNKGEIVFKEGRVNSSDIEFDLEEIRIGGKKVRDPDELLQILQLEKYKLGGYIDDYQDLRQSLKAFSEKIIDKKRSVLAVGGVDGEKKLVTKAHPKVDILFSDDQIELDAGYASDISGRMMSNESVFLFHPGHKPAETKRQVGPLVLLNSVEIPEGWEKLLDDLSNRALDQEIGSTSKNLTYSIILELLAQLFPNPLSVCLHKLGLKMADRLPIVGNGRVTYEEDGVLELKSGKIFEGKYSRVNGKLAREIIRKAAGQPMKIIIFGIDERTREIDGVPDAWRRDEGVNDLRDAVKSLSDGFVFNLFRAPCDDGKQILICVSVN